MDITILPVLSDNYCYLLRNGDQAAAVDPGEAGPVLKALQKINARLRFVLLTHHHADHCGGARDLHTATGCDILGSDAGRMPLTVSVTDGTELSLESSTFRVIATPGHTLDHVCYYLTGTDEQAPSAFTGDTLFSGGCGRFFEGTPEMMLESLKKITALPPETLVYCGHEYTVGNYSFAVSVEPDNKAPGRRLEAAKSARAQGRPTVPAVLGDELHCNPFLRTADTVLRSALGMVQDSDAAVLAELRKRKNAY